MSSKEVEESYPLVGPGVELEHGAKRNQREQQHQKRKMRSDKSNNASSKFARRFVVINSSREITGKSGPYVLLFTVAIFAILVLTYLVFQDTKIEEVEWREKDNEHSYQGNRRDFFLFTKNNVKKDAIPHSNEFSYSDKKSPYEQIWINSLLPKWATKKDAFQAIEDSITPEQRICYVHVGKAGGSSVGCSLGFSLHCSNTSTPLGGLLPQRTTRMFHADTYDCHDDSAYFLFVVRDPVKRIQSDFLYERPRNEEVLKEYFPEYFHQRKEFYIDCPFYTMENVVNYGLRKEGEVKEECKMRAFTALRGTKHHLCHWYFNYQFHLEGIPKNGKILVIRNEHLVQDWNRVEEFIGGQKNIIPPNTTLEVMNKYPAVEKDKYLSEESQRIVCRQLCNEIVSYKSILNQALNLNSNDVSDTVEELRKQCPEYADVEEGGCPFPMPDITEKLINTRGYKYVVMEGSYAFNSDRLEKLMHYEEQDKNLSEKNANDTAVGEDKGDDDGYQLPYST